MSDKQLYKPERAPVAYSDPYPPAPAVRVPGLYHRCGFGVLSGRPSRSWTVMTLAGPARHGILDGVHERVVADAVLHHELGTAHQASHRRAGLERVRIGVVVTGRMVCGLKPTRRPTLSGRAP